MPPQYCIWSWSGLVWIKQYDSCPSGTHCDPPPFEGTYGGQLESTSCEPN